MRAARYHDLPIKSPSWRHDLTNKQFVIKLELIIEPGLPGFLFVARRVASVHITPPVFLLVQFLPLIEWRLKCEKSARYALDKE